MALPGEGGMPSGVNMAQVTAMNMAGQSPLGQAQMRPVFWLANLDYKPVCTPGEMMQWKADKQLIPGAEAVKFLPVMPQGILAKILGEVFGAGFQMEDWAADLSPEQVEALMQARASGIEGGVDTAWIGQQASLKNVAMNNVGGPEVG